MPSSAATHPSRPHSSSASRGPSPCRMPMRSGSKKSGRCPADAAARPISPACSTAHGASSARRAWISAEHFRNWQKSRRTPRTSSRSAGIPCSISSANIARSSMSGASPIPRHAALDSRRQAGRSPISMSRSSASWNCHRNSCCSCARCRCRRIFSSTRRNPRPTDSMNGAD